MKKKWEEQAIDFDWQCEKSRSLISRVESVLSVGADRVRRSSDYPVGRCSRASLRRSTSSIDHVDGAPRRPSALTPRAAAKINGKRSLRRDDGVRTQRTSPGLERVGT